MGETLIEEILRLTIVLFDVRVDDVQQCLGFTISTKGRRWWVRCKGSGI